MLDLVSIRARLGEHRPSPLAPGASTRQAAVAVVLRKAQNGAGDDAEMLFIQRASRPGDPWSGHMAFPGGHLDPDDADLCAAAVRETHEEIGLDISSAPLLGRLEAQRPQAVRRDMLVAPYVFAIEGDPAFSLNYEVAEAVWTAIAPMHSGGESRHRTASRRQRRHGASRLPPRRPATSLGHDVPHGADVLRRPSTRGTGRFPIAVFKASPVRLRAPHA